jgi:2'-5' RNA ligase
MHESFLAVAKTIPCCTRDFVEWHRGIERYGFWAVLVDDRDWLELLETARSHVGQLIHPGYQRAPHITVAACGLLSEEHFSRQLQRRQAAALTEEKVPPFLLGAGALDSFASAPYITVEDPAGSLAGLRSILATISKEDSPGNYKPHITLGLYQEAFETQSVASHLQAFRLPPVRQLLVTELAFCAYETSNVQGPFAVLERVPFAGLILSKKS